MSTPPSKTSWKPVAIIGAAALGCGCVVLMIVAVVAFAAWRRHRHDSRAEADLQHQVALEQRRRQGASEPVPAPVDRAGSVARTEPLARSEVDELLAAQPLSAVREPNGIAVVVLIDTSGSMKDKVRDADGTKQRKLDIARRNVAQLVERAEAAAREHPQRPLQLGIYEFSVRKNVPRCRPIVPLASPSRATVRQALESLRPEGDTPIGDALLAARAELAATGFGHQHVLVVTDGENTKGFKPAQVVEALSRLPDEQHVSTYLIAFDVDAAVFETVERAGALVLPAAGGVELEQSLDYVLTGKILAEQITPSGNSGELR